MSIKSITAGTLTALLLAAPAFAGEHDKMEKNNKNTAYDHDYYHYGSDAAYQWTVEPGQVMMFKRPVSFEGDVIETTASHRVIKADNGMTVQIPNQALVWNGDTQIFAENAMNSDRVVLHMRQDEPYRIMMEMGDKLAVGSYDGVFFLPKAFVNDIALDQLDRDIYRDTADVDLDSDGHIDSTERRVRRYDNDLKSAPDKK